MTSGTTAATQELAAFLRTRREQLDPADFDLRRQRRSRRTPGLRREEVAVLAGVSTEYIVRLEQGRAVRPSAEVLEALARTLRLDPDERAYLFDLAQKRLPSTDKPSTTAAPGLARLVADLSPLPTMLVNHRYDILAWNREMARLLVDFDTLPPRQRNSMWLCLNHAEIRELYVDHEQSLREAIADLRTAWAAHPEDEELAERIAEFTRHEEFARLWAMRDVRIYGSGRKLIRRPEVGTIAVELEVLMPMRDPDLRLVIFRAADDNSRAALDRLCTSA
ncbi:helix-turn-helix transcriptional regulator [Nocardia sp. CDC159]|uniref:Helix-turn-helix transcriptional regulator n=1 Tax=Nocardia pulmonis TaxID=2951408 RepID=A0A9X2E7N3_9NOCA|nr:MULTISPECIES: helix-turn-helix transcriptional regulator [Nocardia]MCM6775264.1 helix-turn-helix transcriptional regulator [Nocardia pulmonis]MCM6788002.1 helix-turn-helix transcriptional regulator [Nocardia sp. CDC159]